LIAEKINKNERKGLADIVSVSQGSEEASFWDYIGGVPKQEIKVDLLLLLYLICSISA